MRLLIDEMYSPEIAERLRRLGHDAVSVHERPELAAASDSEILRLMQTERRIVLTNNHRHFAPLANAVLQSGETFHGILFTADRSLPRNRRTIPVLVRLLGELLERRRGEDTLPAGVEWLVPEPPAAGS